jgi:hypothetical protein
VDNRNFEQEASMAVPPQQTEVILNVAGEGGGYTIMGEQHQGHWRFWRDASNSDAWMYDEDEAPPAPSREPVTEPTICYFATLDEALERINSGWPNLHPTLVHPSFSQDIWNRVVRYCRDNKGSRTRDLLQRWSALCLGREIATVDELDSPP